MLWKCYYNLELIEMIVQHSLLPASKSLTVLMVKGAFWFLWSDHPMLVIATSTQKNIVAPHLQTSSALMLIKPRLGNWLCNPKKWEVQKRKERRKEIWKEKKNEKKQNRKERKKLCHPPVEETPLFFYRKSALSVLQNFNVLMEGR